MNDDGLESAPLSPLTHPPLTRGLGLHRLRRASRARPGEQRDPAAVDRDRLRQEHEADVVAFLLAGLNVGSLQELHATLERTGKLEKALARAAYGAWHLFQMIDRETWRASGGDDGQGHYEGDYHADRALGEIKSWAALAASAPASGEQEWAHVSDTPCPRCGVVRLEVACAAGPGRCPMGWEADAPSSAGVVVPADTIEKALDALLYWRKWFKHAEERKIGQPLWAAMLCEKAYTEGEGAIAALAAVRAPKEDEA